VCPDIAEVFRLNATVQYNHKIIIYL